MDGLMTGFKGSANSGVGRNFRGNLSSLLKHLLCIVLKNLTIGRWLWPSHWAPTLNSDQSLISGSTLKQLR